MAHHTEEDHDMEVDTNTSCPVCLEEYTNITRAPVTCGCGYTACRDCVQEFIVSMVSAPACMECHRSWDMPFLQKECSRKFITTDLGRRRKQLLFDAERARFPETLASPEMEMELKVRADKDLIPSQQASIAELTAQRMVIADKYEEGEIRRIKTITQFRGELVRIQDWVKEIYFWIDHNSYLENPLELNTLGLGLSQTVGLLQNTSRNISQLAASVLETCCAQADLRRAKAAADTNIRHARNMLRKLQGKVVDTDSSKQSKPRVYYKFPCMVSECRGMLNSRWICVLCRTKTCESCFAELYVVGDVAARQASKTHECAEDAQATAELLKTSTKPCPNCQVLIHRVSGCDQMWCTRCQVPFSWKTGQRVSGVVHNPHYFQARDAGLLVHTPNQCEQGDQLLALQETLTTYTLPWRRFRDPAFWNKFTDFVKITLTAYKRIMRVFARPNRSAPTSRERERIIFLCGGRSEDSYKSLLLRRDNDKVRNIARNHIYGMFSVVLTESLHAILQRKRDTANTYRFDRGVDLIEAEGDMQERMFERIECARKYCNAELVKLYDAYGNKGRGFIGPAWTLLRRDDFDKC